MFNNPDPTKVDLWLVYIKYPGGTYEHIKQVRALMDVQVCHLSEWTFDKLVGDSDSHLYRLNNQIEVKDIGCRFSDQIQSKLNKIDQAKRELTFYQNQLDLATSAGLLRAVQMAESNVNETIKRIAKLEKSLEQLIHCQSSTTTSTACQDQSCQDIFEPYFRQTIAPLELGCSIQQFMSFSSPASPFCQDFGESTAFQSSSIGSIDED